MTRRLTLNEIKKHLEKPNKHGSAFDSIYLDARIPAEFIVSTLTNAPVSTPCYGDKNYTPKQIAALLSNPNITGAHITQAIAGNDKIALGAFYNDKYTEAQREQGLAALIKHGVSDYGIHPVVFKAPYFSAEFQHRALRAEPSLCAKGLALFAKDSSVLDAVAQVYVSQASDLEQSERVLLKLANNPLLSNKAAEQLARVALANPSAKVIRFFGGSIAATLPLTTSQWQQLFDSNLQQCVEGQGQPHITVRNPLDGLANPCVTLAMARQAMAAAKVLNNRSLSESALTHLFSLTQVETPSLLSPLEEEQRLVELIAMLHENELSLAVNDCLNLMTTIPQGVFDYCLEHISREDTSVLLARHPSATTALLAKYAYDPYKVQLQVLCHPNVSDETFASLHRSLLQFDPCRDINAIYNSGAFDLLKQFKKLDILANDYGHDLFLFKDVVSPKKMTQMLIGSKHRAEIDFLFHSGDAEALTALSALQSVYTNAQGKIDRHTYLSTLTQLNTLVSPSTPEKKANLSGLAVDAQSLTLVFDFFSLDEIAAILMSNNTHEARDVFRLTASLIERNDGDENTRQRTLVRRWIEKQQDFGALFHDYLSNKQLRDLGDKDVLVPFFQDLLSLDDELAIKDALPDGVRLILPRNNGELKQLGRAQRHCVGTRYYADRCSDGSNVIFALATGSRSNECYTYQFDRFSGRLEQAKGFCNDPVDQALTPLAMSVFKQVRDIAEHVKQGQDAQEQLAA